MGSQLVRHEYTPKFVRMSISGGTSQTRDRRTLVQRCVLRSNVSLSGSLKPQLGRPDACIAAEKVAGPSGRISQRQSLKLVHLLSLFTVTGSIILLMTPAAYHRILEQGEDSEHFHRIAGKILLAAMALLAIGMCGDLYVICELVINSTRISIIAAASMLVLFYSLWFALPLAVRTRSGRKKLE